MIARQFASAARLFSAEGYGRIQTARVGIVGVGGVGSWAAEALARSGVGQLTLVDMDHVSEGNINRQVQASHDTLGMSKVRALAERLVALSPSLDVQMVDDFLTVENAAAMLPEADFWIDACDDLPAKLAMVTHFSSRDRSRQLVVSGGAGGKTDPTRVRRADLADTSQDALLSKLRYTLRRSHGFSREGRMRVPVVYCEQAAVAGADCDPSARLACAGYGSLVTVTAAMGLACAAQAMDAISRR